MADHTLKTVELILDKCFAALGNLLVTSLTSYFHVFSVEFELRFIVVEFVHFPGFEAVTPGTVRDAKLFKLAVVLILMAT